MAKENKQEASAEEQLAAAVEAKRQALADKMAAFEDAASFKALVAACTGDLGVIKDSYAMALEAIKSIDDKVKLQAVAVAAARDFAAKNGLTSNAVVLGHEPLVAHSMLNMSELAWPAVMRPMFYFSQFPSKEDLWVNIQLTLNQGQPVLAMGGQQNNESIARALLNGMKPNEIQNSKPEAVTEKASMSNWFGFRPKAA